MAIFTPDDEPYLGRESVHVFDQVILDAMPLSNKIGSWTRGKELSPIQTAATELLPHGFSIALSIRELVRQAYLISAEILLRPLIERAAVISYLCETPSALSLWEAGWPHKSRPPLVKMLATMVDANQDNELLAKQFIHSFNAVIHADPSGARNQAVKLEDGSKGFTASKSLYETRKCDSICLCATTQLIVLKTRAIRVFPEAVA